MGRQDAVSKYQPAARRLALELAARVAKACGVPHHLIRVEPDFFADFPSLADRTVYITDGSFGVCGAHEIYLNSRARDLAPLRLTGNFGSEILRSVTMFKPLRLTENLFDPDVRRNLAAVAPPIPGRESDAVSLAAFTEIPLHLF